MWLEAVVLLDELLCGAEEVIAAFELDDAWLIHTTREGVTPHPLSMPINGHGLEMG
jgi:hypothetical protein